VHSEETPDVPPTEGETVPPGEPTVPSTGQVQEDEQTQGDDRAQGKAEEMADKVKEAAPEQMQSLAREKPMPIALAAAFVAGVVVGRIASRR